MDNEGSWIRSYSVIFFATSGLIVRDGSKWLLMPSKIILDGLCMWPENQFGLRKLGAIFYFATSVAILFGQILFITDQGIKNLATFATGFSFIFLSVEVIVRRLLCHTYKNRMAKVINKVCNEFWPSNILGTKTHQELSRQSFYLMLYFSACITFACLRASEGVILSLPENVLPLYTKYSNDRRSPYYQLLYVIEAFLVVEASLNVCGFDFFVCSLILNCAAQFKLLRKSVKREFQNGSVNKAEILKTLIIRHNELISVCNEVEDIFTKFVLVQYLASIGAVCLSSFIAVAEPADLTNALPFVVGHTCLIFIYCCMGENLNNESILLSDTIYECGWHSWENDKHLQKDIVLVLVRSQRAIKISIGGFGYLNLSSFMKLIQFSFSVLTFLNKVMNK